MKLVLSECDVVKILFLVLYSVTFSVFMKEMSKKTKLFILFFSRLNNFKIISFKQRFPVY